jgi:tetratricopeptide (TPR) repeat protein
VKRSSTVGAWVRREQLLIAVLGLAAAAAALANPLGVHWLLIVALGIAVLGAIARVVVVIEQDRVARVRETKGLERRLRVPAAPVSEVNPQRVGVDPAAQTVLPGGSIPQYSPRLVDETIRRAIEDAVDGGDLWIIAVSGPSKAGKSRTLFEALRSCRMQEELRLVAPVDGDALRSLLDDAPARLRESKPILWLDDLEPFVAQGVTLDTLREWHEATGMPVLATYGGKGSERVGESPGMRELTELTRTLLQHAREILLDATSSSELARLPLGLSPGVRSEISRHGLAAYLVAAPALERKLTTRRHGPGDRESPEGAAVVHAAVDWSLCGRTDPISPQTLRRLWPTYVGDGTAATDSAFDAGVDWALRRVAGSIALLRRAGGYVAYDYIVSFVRGRPDAVDPRDEAWACATDTSDPGQAFAVGVAAWAYDRVGYAIAAFEIAQSRGAREVAGRASFNLALAHRRRGEVAETAEAYRGAIRSGHPDAGPRAAAALGVLLQQQDDVEGAREAFQTAIDSGNPEAATTAAVSLGVLLELQGDVRGARRSYESATQSPDRDVRAVALLQLSALLEREGDHAGAQQAYRRAVASGPDETEVTARAGWRVRT